MYEKLGKVKYRKDLNIPNDLPLQPKGVKSTYFHFRHYSKARKDYKKKILFSSLAVTLLLPGIELGSGFFSGRTTVQSLILQLFTAIYFADF